MTPKQIRAAKKSYLDMFADDMSDRAVEIAKEIETHRDLEMKEDELSAGEFDCLSWEISS